MAVDFPQPEYRDSTRVHAGIRLIGESVEPDAITRALGISPSHTLIGDERPSQQAGWLLNSSVRRPGMFGSHQAETDLSDLAFIDRAERTLESLGAKLVERGWWSSTGFQGALEQTFGNLDCAKSIGQAPIVEVSLALGWMELDRYLERDEYWRLANTSPHWLDERLRSSDDLEAEFGPPSIRIGGQWEASLGFGADDATLPLVWFDVRRNGEIASLRRASDTILDEFIVGRPEGFDAAAAASSVDARQTASNPFRRGKGQ